MIYSRRKKNTATGGSRFFTVHNWMNGRKLPHFQNNKLQKLQVTQFIFFQNFTSEQVYFNLITLLLPEITFQLELSHTKNLSSVQRVTAHFKSSRGAICTQPSFAIALSAQLVNGSTGLLLPNQ